MFAAARGNPFPLLADPQRAVYLAYGVESRLLSLGQRPALFSIDRSGLVRYAFLGTQQWQLGDLDEALAALFTNRQLADPAWIDVRNYLSGSLTKQIREPPSRTR